MKPPDFAMQASLTLPEGCPHSAVQYASTLEDAERLKIILRDEHSLLAQYRICVWSRVLTPSQVNKRSFQTPRLVSKTHHPQNARSAVPHIQSECFLPLHMQEEKTSERWHPFLCEELGITSPTQRRDERGVW